MKQTMNQHRETRTWALSRAAFGMAWLGSARKWCLTPFIYHLFRFKFRKNLSATLGLHKNTGGIVFQRFKCHRERDTRNKLRVGCDISVLFSDKWCLKPLALISTLLLVPFLTGCNMSDPMTKAMDDAYALRKSNEDVSRVVQENFPPGMATEEVFKLLRKLKDRGYEVVEHRFEGALLWPDGDLKPYRDEISKKAFQPKRTFVLYIARMQYDRKLIIFEKRVGVKIQTDGKKIVDSSGFIVEETRIP